MPRPAASVVTLTETERLSLLDRLKQEEVNARMVPRTRLLLRSAEGATDQSRADGRTVSPQPVRNSRKRCAAEGREAAVQERPRPGAQPNLDGKQEAFLIAPACSAPPEGRERGTMPLLANRLVALTIVESIADATVRRVLNKTTLSPGRSSSGASHR
jgi:hypothetical protein